MLKKFFSRPTSVSNASASKPASQESANLTFQQLGLREDILRAIQEEGYTKPTPIQCQAIPHVLASRDVLGCAQTGTGKTAAFTLPILHRLKDVEEAAASTRRQARIRVLILAPTRELAIQIDESVANYGRHTGLSHAVIFGGVGQNPQVNALRRGPAVVTATPGRLLDLMNQREVDLSGLEIFVLDEADRMLDMGFIRDVRKIIAALPKRRQNLLFSATMPADIKSLADDLLHNPAYVEVAPVSSTAESITQYVYFVNKSRKTKLLIHLLQSDKNMRKTLAFTRTKHGANRVAKALSEAGITAEAIHGNKSQSARQRALNGFKDGAISVLVASDIAARGIDVEEITHVFNVDLPNIPETYVHRIGRTGRAQATGAAIAFCDVQEERFYLRDIEKLTGKKLTVVDEHPFVGQPDASEQGDDHERRPPRGPRPSRPQHGSRAQQGGRQGGGGNHSGRSQGQNSQPRGPGRPGPGFSGSGRGPASESQAGGQGGGKRRRRKPRPTES